MKSTTNAETVLKRLETRTLAFRTWKRLTEPRRGTSEHNKLKGVLAKLAKTAEDTIIFVL